MGTIDINRLILSTKNNAAPFVALLVNTRESACRIIRLQSGLNLRLLTAQGIFSVVKSEREKVGSAVCHVCKINFVKTGHFIGNLLTNSRASAPLNEILTGNFKLSLNMCIQFIFPCLLCQDFTGRVLLNINVVSAIDPSLFENR